MNCISFDVGRGEIVGLLGPNGAGNAATINMILGVLEVTDGCPRRSIYRLLNRVNQRA